MSDTEYCEPLEPDTFHESHAPVPADVEEYRDQCRRREGTRQVETAFEAERFIEQVAFAFCMTGCRRPGPSLYLAVCGGVMLS
jgi:hypothetical protein